jgi:uncharacterized protein (DUF4415 family)
MGIERRIQMARKLSASSRLGKQTRRSAEAIWNKPLTERQKVALDAVATRQERAGASQATFLRSLRSSSSQFRRPPKRLVAVRLDADVFEWLPVTMRFFAR